MSSLETKIKILVLRGKNVIAYSKTVFSFKSTITFLCPFNLLSQKQDRGMIWRTNLSRCNLIAFVTIIFIMRSLIMRPNFVSFKNILKVDKRSQWVSNNSNLYLFPKSQNRLHAIFCLIFFLMMMGCNFLITLNRKFVISKLDQPNKRENLQIIFNNRMRF